MDTVNAAGWRIGIFATVLLALVVLELVLTGPNPLPRRSRRWPANLGLVLVDTLLARVLVPAGVVGAALWAQSRGIGAFHVLDWPGWSEFAVALLLLDAAIYWQHRLLHAVPWFWRLHRVHHTDTTLDASSALRFHPLEIVLSLAIKMAVVIALGASPLVVLVFEILLSSFALVTHANLPLPRRLDHALRTLLVTPAMHRIHHSTHVDEQQRNFGFHLSVWDRLFRSYAADARDAPQAFGVAGVAVDQATRFTALMREPFARRA